MKLINAGLGGLLWQNFLFNCTRNKNCQPEFYIPIRQVSDLVFFADLPGKPDELGYSFNAVDSCCSDTAPALGDFNTDFNDDFLIGESLEIPCEYQVVFNDYVIGQRPNGSWYAVFGNPTIAIPEGVTLKCFYLKIIITVGGGDYVYYSNHICVEDCDPLVMLQACYPNLESGEAEDCNGIYYGFHQGPEEVIGTENYRYFHKAFVRKGSLISSKLSLSFTLFNSKKNYRTVVNKEKVLEFEVVPDFYKDILLGIFARGNILIEGVSHTLTEQQEFQVIDYDAKLWQLDVNLLEECKQSFGCGPSDCTLPPLPPEPCLIGNCTPVSVNLVEGQYQGSFPGPCELVEGELIEWEVRNSIFNIVDSGTISTGNEIFIIDAEGFDPVNNCYSVRWRKKCVDGTFTGWESIQYGDCGVGQENIECSAAAMNFTGTVTVTKTPFSIIGMTGTLNCSFVCPCNLLNGTIITRITPSSPCLPACNLIDSSGNWRLGTTGYITYIGPDVVIPCEGLELNQSFNEEDCGI